MTTRQATAALAKYRKTSLKKSIAIPPTKPFFPKEDIKKLREDLQEILDSGRLTLGKYTESFESSLSKAVGTKHSVAVNSGTSALEITLRAINVKDVEVIVPTNTFSASASSVIFAGGKPVLSDIDSDYLCMEPEDVKRRITQKTRAIMVVHPGGFVCPHMSALREICEDHRLFLIEDAAQAHGSTNGEKNAGAIGDVGCFSFYATKVVTAGEGGAITTDLEEISSKARIMRDQGKETFGGNKIVMLGYNWRISEINAAVALSQLKRLKEFIEKRTRIAKVYDQLIERIPEAKPLKPPKGFITNYYKYVVILDERVNRDSLKKKLSENSVQCSGEVHWPPLHMQPAYQELLGVREGEYPKSEKVLKQMICLPMSAAMTTQQARYVVQELEEALSHQ